MSLPDNKVQQDLLQRRIQECLKTEQAFDQQWETIRAFCQSRLRTIEAIEALEDGISPPLDTKHQVESNTIDPEKFYVELNRVAEKVRNASNDVAQPALLGIQNLTFSNIQEVQKLEQCFNTIASNVIPQYRDAVLLYSQFMDSRFIEQIQKEQFDTINAYFRDFFEIKKNSETIQSVAFSVIKRCPQYVQFSEHCAQAIAILQPVCKLDTQSLLNSVQELNESVGRHETKVLAARMHQVLSTCHSNNTNKKELVEKVRAILQLIIHPSNQLKQDLDKISEGSKFSALCNNFSSDTRYLCYLARNYENLNNQLSGPRTTVRPVLQTLFSWVPKNVINFARKVTDDESTPYVRQIIELIAPFEAEYVSAAPTPDVTAKPGAKK